MQTSTLELKRRLSERHTGPLGETVDAMLRLVEDAIRKGFLVEAIAD